MPRKCRRSAGLASGLWPPQQLDSIDDLATAALIVFQLLSCWSKTDRRDQKPIRILDKFWSLALPGPAAEYLQFCQGNLIRAQSMTFTIRKTIHPIPFGMFTQQILLFGNWTWIANGTRSKPGSQQIRKSGILEGQQDNSWFQWQKMANTKLWLQVKPTFFADPKLRTLGSTLFRWTLGKTPSGLRS